MEKKKICIYSCRTDQAAARSHELLFRAAALQTGTQAYTLARTPRGKPYFENSALQFSITHSGSFWMCAFGDVPLGLDLQQHRDSCRQRALSERFFHPAEDAFLRRENDRRFFDLWCAKESYLKYTGEGICDRLGAFCVVGEAGQFPCVQDAFLQLLDWQAEYSLCLCTPGPAEAVFIQL